MNKVAFIGLGNMGGPMAINLTKKLFPVVGFDLMPEALSAFKKEGGNTASSLHSACEGAEVLITMLPSGKHLQQVLSEERLSHLRKGSLVIDCSTIDPATARHLGALVEKQGSQMIDAPVSGGTAGAKNGTLTFMVGGTEQALEQATPYLKAMGANIFHAGPSGAGQVVKICNNMLLAIHMIGTCEALNLGAAHGLDPKTLSHIMQKSSGRNWSLEVYNPFPGVMESVPASRNYTGGFAVELMIKDLGLAVEASLNTQTSIPLGAAARNLYNLWLKNGGKQMDFSSIFQFLKDKKGSSHDEV